MHSQGPRTAKDRETDYCLDKGTQEYFPGSGSQMGLCNGGRETAVFMH